MRDALLSPEQSIVQVGLNSLPNIALISPKELHRRSRKDMEGELGRTRFDE